MNNINNTTGIVSIDGRYEKIESKPVRISLLKKQFGNITEKKISDLLNDAKKCEKALDDIKDWNQNFTRTQFENNIKTYENIKQKFLLITTDEFYICRGKKLPQVLKNRMERIFKVLNRSSLFIEKNSFDSIAKNMLKKCEENLDYLEDVVPSFEKASKQDFKKSVNKKIFYGNSIRLFKTSGFAYQDFREIIKKVESVQECKDMTLKLKKRWSKIHFRLLPLELFTRCVLFRPKI